MGQCKKIELRVIPSQIANPFVCAHHYSGTFVRNSQLHFGAFFHGALHGVLSFGPSMDKSKIQGLVADTPWNGFVELNRMGFDEVLPKNAESYCIGRALRLIKRNAAHIKWVVSFADGCSCGDGTIYRASNFILTGIQKNSTILELPWGERISNITMSTTKNSARYARILNRLGVSSICVSDYARLGIKRVDGFMLRYIYFLDPSFRARLTVPEIPFSRIDEIGAGLYKGAKIEQSARHEQGIAWKTAKEALP